MYEATTHGIRVKVEPQFLEHESDPDTGRYFWAYTIEITNESVSDDTAKVEFDVLYQDGSRVSRSVSMTREEGQWRLGYIDPV